MTYGNNNNNTGYTFVFHSDACLYTDRVNRHNDELNTREYPDAGFNLYAFEPVDYAAGDRSVTWNTGVKGTMLDASGRSVPYTVEPRSSICKTPLRMANSRGIIDAGYRGNLLVKCDAFDKFEMAAGTSYFQVLAPNLAPFAVKRVTAAEFNHFETTERGAGGFGSTGGN
jgi:dUTP pyrophosphatase